MVLQVVAFRYRLYAKALLEMTRSSHNPEHQILLILLFEKILSGQLFIAPPDLVTIKQSGDD